MRMPEGPQPLYLRKSCTSRMPCNKPPERVRLRCLPGHRECLCGVAFRLHVVPDVLNFAVRANQKRAAHNSQKRFAEEFLHPPRPVSFDHFEFRIAQQRKIQLVLFLKARLRFHRVAAGPQDHYVQLFELFLRVAKLGRFHRSTRSIRLRKEKQQHPFPAKLGQRDVLAVVALHPEVRSLIANFQHFQSPRMGLWSAAVLATLSLEGPPLLRSRQQYTLFYESSRRKISFTACGFACPRVARITWPTKNLNTPSFPPLNFATLSGFFAITSRAACSIAEVSLICVNPSAATISTAPRPLSNIVANTFFPTAPVIFPSSTSFSNSASAAGETGDASISFPESFSRRKSSVCIQFAALFAEPPAFATASK